MYCILKLTLHSTETWQLLLSQWNVYTSWDRTWDWSMDIWCCLLFHVILDLCISANLSEESSSLALYLKQNKWLILKLCKLIITFIQDILCKVETPTCCFHLAFLNTVHAHRWNPAVSSTSVRGNPKLWLKTLSDILYVKNVSCNLLQYQSLDSVYHIILIPLCSINCSSVTRSCSVFQQQLRTMSTANDSAQKGMLKCALKWFRKQGYCFTAKEWTNFHVIITNPMLLFFKTCLNSREFN
jgi:hypothetical protein